MGVMDDCLSLLNDMTDIQLFVNTHFIEQSMEDVF